ncbi:MAG TPA: hypothetical protein PK986_00800 [Spirochaetota bacterium]|nr:hypothetical protein [Spirochaetota bacterium]HQO38983.1 hypothetical protein [Spirochaetota bacterium]
MKKSSKRIISAVIIFVILIAGGFILNRCNEKRASVNGSPSADIRDREEKLQLTPIIEKNSTPIKSTTAKFKTSEDIKLKYGKLEEVFLYNGKRYEGAVISINEFYTIVTVDGTFKIPMQQVKLRNIIR